MQAMKKLVSAVLATAMLFATAGAFADGSYRAEAEGKMGPVEVEVVFDGNTVKEVNVIAQNETEAIAAGALELIPKEIIAAQSLEVEAVSGATVTGDAIIAAVAKCAEQAGVVLSGEAVTVEKKLNDGTYTAAAHGHHADVKVEVVVAENAIVSVIVLESGETANIAAPAIERVPAAVVANQSVNVDMVSGATYTSRAIVTAVSDAIVQAGGDVLAFNVPAEKAEVTRTAVEETYDVAVVGSGLAGVSAALSAQEAGAKVVLIEKLPYIGGISQTAAGGVVYPAGEQKKGFEEYLLNRNVGNQQGWMNTPNAIISAANVHALAENAEDSVNWLVSQGVGMMMLEGISPEHYTVMAEDGTLIPNVNYVNCNLLIDAAAPDAGGIALNKMAQNFVALGGVIYTEAAAFELITADGAVTGVKAAGPATDYTFNVKSVILCAGGFGASEELIERFAPAHAGEVNTTLCGNTGDGILMAEAVGAAVYEDGYMMGGSAQSVVTDLDMISPYTDSETPKSALYVNVQGIRVNSEDPEAYSNSIMYVNPDSRDYYWVVINEAVASADPAYMAILENGLASEPDRFFTAKSVTDLAKKMRVVPNTLINTVDNYNFLCEKGEDTALFKNAEYLVPMTEGPWYAVKAYMQYFGTVGGVVTNEKAQVLDTEGNVIAGLYAAGENSNHGVFERCYSGGISLTEALTFGRIAGLDAAANK